MLCFLGLYSIVKELYMMTYNNHRYSNTCENQAYHNK